MQICGVDFGLSISSTELRRKITELGWRIEQVKFDGAKDRYVAKAISTRGKRLERAGKTERLALANMLLAVQARDSSVKLGRWNVNFTDRLQAIAEAYSKAPSYTAKASEPFLALAADSKRRADVLGRHLAIEIVNDPEPYKTPQKMVDDIRKRRKLVVSRAGAVGHPMWTEQEVVAYRICHDVLGYAAANTGWDWEGENEAFAHHVHLLGEQAQLALFTESLGLSAYNTFYHAFGPQKIATFPQFMNEAQSAENPHKGWHGMHPDESAPPIEMPSVKPIVSRMNEYDEPYEKIAVFQPTGLTDPNYGYQSTVQPVVNAQGLTLKQQYQFPLADGTLTDPLDEQAARENITKLYRPWAEVNNRNPDVKSMMDENQMNGGPQFTEKEFDYIKQSLPGEYERMRTAITNAFRAVLHSPKTRLAYNAMNYQNLSSVSPYETDPFVIHKALDDKRREYNVERWEAMHPGQGEEVRSHLGYARYLKNDNGGPGALVKWVAQREGIPEWEAQTKAERMCMEWAHQEEEELLAEDKDKPVEKQRLPFQVESKAAQNVAVELKAMLAAHRKKEDYAIPEPLQRAAAEIEAANFMDEAQNIPELAGLPGPRRYPGWMVGTAVTIARIQQHVDDLLYAALEDVHNHNGTGLHFRGQALQILQDIDKVGPKVISFAWLLLQPLTSELATIDSHMMNVMGSNKQAPEARDYFAYERAFRDRMNAAGYPHVPTGMAQWMIWDNERTGPGSHQDHAPLAVEKPVPWHQVPWQDNPEDLYSNPDWAANTPWWAATEPYQEQALEDFQNTEAGKVGAKKIPYQGLPEQYGTIVTPGGPGDARTAATTLPVLTPWFVHPWTSERIEGLPGQSIMQHATQTLGMSVPEIWAMLDNAGKV